MKRALTLFGVLDIITLIRSTRQISEMYNGLTGPFWSVALGNLVMYSSLLVSGFLLIRQKQIGIWITYGQFPLRITYQIMSFGFLWGLLGYFSNADTASYYFSMTLLILEVIRLLTTIVIHKKLQ